MGDRDRRASQRLAEQHLSRTAAAAASKGGGKEPTDPVSPDRFRCSCTNANDRWKGMMCNFFVAPDAKLEHGPLAPLNYFL